MKNVSNENFVPQLGLFNIMPCSRVRKANAKSIAFLSACPSICTYQSKFHREYLKFIIWNIYSYLSTCSGFG
jgi:hypothetical protein